MVLLISLLYKIPTPISLTVLTSQLNMHIMRIRNKITLLEQVSTRYINEERPSSSFLSQTKERVLFWLVPSQCLYCTLI